MIRLLLIVTIALSTLSAFFAYKTRGRGIESNVQRESAEKKVQSTEARLVKEKNEKKEIEAKAKKLEKEGGEHKDLAERTKQELAKVQAETAKLAAAMKEKEMEAAKLKEDIAAMPRVDVAKAAAAETEAKVVDLKTQLDKAQQAARENEKRAEDLAKKMEEASKKKEVDSHKAIVAKKEAIRKTVGQIVAYNEGWNFVVVSIGDNHGVTPDSQLEVLRDGKAIAKLRVTQVQPTQATAGVSSKGVKFQPKDTVIFAPSASSSSGGASLDTARIP
jgi:hypothetical protein